MAGLQIDRAALLIRLRRIEGQIRGLARMIGSDKGCVEVLIQMTAAQRALEAVAVVILDAHLRHCVADAAGSGVTVPDETVREALEAVAHLVGGYVTEVSDSDVDTRLSSRHRLRDGRE